MVEGGRKTEGGPKNDKKNCLVFRRRKANVLIKALYYVLVPELSAKVSLFIKNMRFIMHITYIE